MHLEMMDKRTDGALKQTNDARVSEWIETRNSCIRDTIVMHL